MRSMTGFGRAEHFDASGKIGFKVEILSINKKQFELKLSIPRELGILEIPLRTFVAERLTRGTVTLRIELVRQPGVLPPTVDLTRAKAVLEAARKFCLDNEIPGEVTISDLLSMPDAVQIQTADYSDENMETLLKQTVGDAIERLLEMRTREGENLRKELLLHLEVMEQLLAEIEPLAARLPEQQMQKLYKRLKEMDLPADTNDERILREAVLYGDKLDVTEEIERLHSHFRNFRRMTAEQNSVGRSLDFMVQEIFRECNTLGNKAASTDISPKAVALKTELEKIREQVQNIE